VPGEIGEGVQIVGGARVAGVGETVSRALEHRHQWHALLERQLCDAMALGRTPGTDGAAQQREVLGARQHGPAVDPPQPAHVPIARNVFDGAHQPAELDEAAGVEEPLDALASVELSAAVHEPLDALGPAHLERAIAAPLQLLEPRLPFLAIALARFPSRQTDSPRLEL
jgi:hypothetical protein